MCAAGITAGKRLSEKGVNDFLILEGQSIIGGRMHKQKFGGLSIEKGANWVEGVNGPELNPILPLVQELGLRNAKSDYTNVSSNIYNAGYVTYSSQNLYALIVCYVLHWQNADCKHASSVYICVSLEEVIGTAL